MKELAFILQLKLISFILYVNYQYFFSVSVTYNLFQKFTHSKFWFLIFFPQNILKSFIYKKLSSLNNFVVSYRITVA